MGLESLDLIFRLEKRFGIDIPNDEGLAVMFATAGNIHRYLVAKLNGQYQEVPYLQPLWKEMSGAIARVRGRWKLTSIYDLNKCFTHQNRADNWKALGKELNVSLPDLEIRPDDPFPCIPRQCDSLTSLSYWIADNYPQRVEWLAVSCEPTGKTAVQLWSDDEVWEILRECICDALGVKPENVTHDTRMVEDLGMG